MWELISFHNNSFDMGEALKDNRLKDICERGFANKIEMWKSMSFHRSKSLFDINEVLKQMHLWTSCKSIK